MRSVTDFLPGATSSPGLGGEGLEQVALLGRKARGNEHAQLNDQAATRAATANAGHAEVTDAHGVAVLRAGGDRDLNDLVRHNALDLDLAAESRLRNRDIAHEVQVVAVALKALVVGDANVDDQVARGLAAKAGLAKAAHAQLAAGRNARREYRCRSFRGKACGPDHRRSRRDDR